MTAWRIPLYKIFWDEEDVKAAERVIRRGTFWAVGPEIDEFEKEVAEYVGTKYAVAFSSGTTTLHAIMLACGIGKGDKVITPSFTFIATANAPLFTGATPFFADIETDTFGLDARKVEQMLGKRVKAVMPIHYGGMPCRDIEAMRELTRQRKALLIEDAAESIGAEVNRRKVGSFGNVNMFSLCGNKVITTGEGGVATTDSGEIYEKLKLIRSHGRLESEPYFLTVKTLDYIELGYNWRMPSIIAAIGSSQLRKLDKVTSLRRKCAEYYSDRLRGIKWLRTPTPAANVRHVFQMYTIRVLRGRKTRDRLRDFLSKKGIMTKVYFEPVHLTLLYREKYNHKEGELPATEKVAGEVVTLPIYPSMTKEEIDYVVDSIREFASSLDS